MDCLESYDTESINVDRGKQQFNHRGKKITLWSDTSLVAPVGLMVLTDSACFFTNSPVNLLSSQSYLVNPKAILLEYVFTKATQLNL